jgi:hypothetical protein
MWKRFILHWALVDAIGESRRSQRLPGRYNFGRSGATISFVRFDLDQQLAV